VEVDWSESTLVMFGRMVFGEVIGWICSTWGPEIFEMTLLDFGADPAELHMNGARVMLLVHDIVSDATVGGIVGLDGCCFLWIAHFIKCGARDFTFFGIDKEASYFGFGG
jgi:hypothetical protein